jgi:hypothetical protein
MRLADHNSHFILRIVSKLSVPDADAYGLYHVMRWLKDLNAKNVIFELYSDLFELAGLYYPKLIYFVSNFRYVFETLPSFIHDAIVNEMT